MTEINNTQFASYVLTVFLILTIPSGMLTMNSFAYPEDGVPVEPAYLTSFSQEKVVSIVLSTPLQLGKLLKEDITVVKVDASKVTAYVTTDELQQLQEQGYTVNVLYNSIPEMKGWTENPLFSRDFHDYPGVTAELTQIANDYPNISALYELGQSVQGRSIWGLKITDNPLIEENEPEIRICGAHHGDELMSVELPLLLAWHLVENYTVDPNITDLIDNREIWIIPLVNPDGRMHSPYPTRRNANNIDLNRDYGYMWDGSGSSPAPFSQPETQAIRNNALENNFVLSLSFHTSGDIVNYIWNYKGEPVADHDVVVNLSNQYGSHNGYWVVEGYDWYQTRGDTNDFSYGCRGDIDWTIEVQDNNIPEAWDLNRDAMIEIIDAANRGLTGVVTDSATGQPLAATIWVEGAYWPCYTDPLVGDYHKVLLPGEYTVHFQANGYEEAVVNVTVAAGDEPTVLNMSLNRNNNYYAYQVTWCNFYDPYYYPNNFQNNPTEATSALGPPDNICASLGVGGELVLDMGAEGEIGNGPGDDFIIYEGDGSADGYLVSVADYWDGPYVSFGAVTGTTAFDLEDISLEHARYIKIEDDGDGDPYENNPGVDIDAVQVFNLNTTSSTVITQVKTNWNFIALPFNQSINKTEIMVTMNNVTYTWTDAVAAGIISDYLFGWDRNAQSYHFANMLEPGYGYWMYAYQPCGLWVENMSITPDDYITALKSKWNIVGLPDYNPVNKTDLIVSYGGTGYTWSDAVAAGIISDYIFNWDRTGQTYTFADTLESGYCYWMYAWYPCVLHQ